MTGCREGTLGNGTIPFSCPSAWLWPCYVVNDDFELSDPPASKVCRHVPLCPVLLRARDQTQRFMHGRQALYQLS